MHNQENEESATNTTREHPSTRAVWRERMLVLLIVASLGGTLNLVITVHRRALTDRERERAPGPVAAVAPPPADPPNPTPAPAPSPPRVVAAPKPAAPPVPMPPPEDPTKKAVGELSAATAAEIEAARQADRKAEAHEKARQAAVSESERWRRREMLVKQQVDSLSERARMIDRQIDTLAAQRDVLGRERDALKAAVSKAQQGEGSYAVLPYKGPNGSWRRPIVLECSNGSVTLRPNGPTFSMLDLSAMINPRSSPVIVAIARELLRIQGSESPDGAPVVPYFVFLVRPDGIRPYYELRARLEPLGIAFGYELIEQDLKVDVPDFDNLATWDGTIPLEAPALADSGGGSGSFGGGNGVDGLAWPGAGPARGGDEGSSPGEFAGRSGRLGSGGAGADNDPDSPEAFVWPGQRTPRGPSGGGRVSSPGAGTTAGRGQGAGVRGSEDRGPGGSDRIGRGPGGTGGRRGLNFALEPPGSAQDGMGRPGGTGRRAEGAMADAFELLPAPGNAAGPGPAGLGGGGIAAGGSGDPTGLPGRSVPGTGGGRSLPPSMPGSAGQGESLAGLPDFESIGGNSGQRSGEGRGVSIGDPAGTGASRGPSGGWPRSGAAGAGSGRGPSAAARPSTVDPTEEAVSDLDAALLGGPAGAVPGASSSGVGQAVSALLGGPTNGTPGTGTSRGGSVVSSVPGGRTNAASGATSGGGGSAGTAGSVGIGLGSQAAAGSSAAPSGGSGLVLGPEGSSAASSGANSGKGDQVVAQPRVGSRIPDGPTRTIEVPFEITVVCQPSGLVIHPGGYQLTRASLDRNKKDGVIVRELLAVARQRAAADPSIRPQPRVKFLVENGGSSTFWDARKQILFSGLSWPMSLQISDAQGTRLLEPETW